MNSMLNFQPDLIEPTDTKGHPATVDSIGVGVLMRDGNPYLRVVIGNSVAEAIGVYAGARLGMGISQDRKTAVLAHTPNEAIRGWKLTRQSGYALTFMVKADKLGLGGLKQTPLKARNFIRYDNQIIADLSDLTNEEA